MTLPTDTPSFRFSHDTNDFATHQPVLYEVLKRTNGPILELGCGEGSTPLIHHFATERKIVTIEQDPAYFESLRARYENEKHEFVLISDWNQMLQDPCFGRPWDVVFIDQNPWEARYHSLLKFRDLAQFIVLHDSDYFPGNSVFGTLKQPIIPFLDEGLRDYSDVFRYWREFFPKKPWIVETGPPTLVGSNLRPCDFDVSFDV